MNRVRKRAAVGERRPKRWALLATAWVLACTACAAQAPQKIRFDLARVDERGLQGHGDGLRSLAYEFCVPVEPSAYLDTVMSVNPGLQCSKHSRGRIACSDVEMLCIGDTHDQGVPALQALAALDFIVEIREAHFE
jgi:hypothetical protein